MPATQTATPADPVTTSYVLPQPPRERAEIGRSEAVSNWRAGLRLGADAVRDVGSRLQALIECQQRFLGEMRATLGEMDESVHEETRARMKGQVRTLTEILGWAEAVQTDLAHECDRASVGQQPIDLTSIVSRVAADFSAAHGVAVQVLGATSTRWWGDLEKTVDMIDLALSIVSRRVGEGAVAIEIGENGGWQNVRVVGSGEPVQFSEPELIARFRNVARQLSVAVLPDELGSGGSSLVLRFAGAAPPAS
jgi:hypothetical protein